MPANDNDGAVTIVLTRAELKRLLREAIADGRERNAADVALRLANIEAVLVELRDGKRAKTVGVVERRRAAHARARAQVLAADPPSAATLEAARQFLARR
jgi:hypothetical protein